MSRDARRADVAVRVPDERIRAVVEVLARLLVSRALVELGVLARE